MTRYQPCLPLGNKSAFLQHSPHCQFFNLTSNRDQFCFKLATLGHTNQHTKKINVSIVNILSFEPRKGCASKYELFTIPDLTSRPPKQPPNKEPSGTGTENKNLQVQKPPNKKPSRTRNENRKLLVLDLNGVLADVTLDFRKNLGAPKYIEKKAVFKRPFCDEFLKFAFDNFNIGIWSSRRRKNLDRLIDYLMGDMKSNLLFCWDGTMCTDTGFTTIGNLHKPLMLKEMEKIWTKEQNDFPLEKGQFSPSNTLLIDDSPYKALCNPPFTAIFPHPYDFRDEDDTALAKGGYFRGYLEELALANDVQEFVRENPIGQKPISNSTPKWKFYKQVIKRMKSSNFTFSSTNKAEKINKLNV